MFKTKKMLVLLMILSLVGSMFIGCSTNSATDSAPKEKIIKIGVSISSFDDTFLMYMKDGMEEYAKTLDQKIEVTYVDAKEDVATQLGQVENFITQEMDSIVVIPVNTEATQPITDAANEANINLIYVNRLPANLPENVTFVGSKSIDAGLFQMEYLAEKMGGKGNVVIMMGKLSNEASLKRTEGVHEIADKFDDIDVIKEQTAEWSRAKGMSLMENWISSGDEITAVACNNDDMALGAIEALQAAGLKDKILVGGVDATPDAIASLAKGDLDVTVFQDASGQGRGGIESAYKLAIGETVDHEVWIPFKLVTPDNYKDFQ